MNEPRWKTIDSTNPTTGQVAAWNGSRWMPQDVNDLVDFPEPPPVTAAIIDADTVSDGSVGG